MNIRRILITGATGNVGYETILGLIKINTHHELIAAVNNTQKAKNVFSSFENISVRKLDFSNPATFASALKDIDIVFLLRPPQLADIPKYFSPLIDEMKNAGISNIVFLSVQGVESQKRIPHHQLEQLILRSGLNYVFLRPSYFMQNLTTTLIDEIRHNSRIYVPGGGLKFNWVDVKDIGLVSAHVLHDFEKFKNSSLEITGSEFKDFNEVATMLSEGTGRKITYASPGLFRFYHASRKKGISTSMILVMIMLHFLPRFKKSKKRLTTTVKEITGNDPGTLKEFIAREKEKFMA